MARCSLRCLRCRAARSDTTRSPWKSSVIHAGFVVAWMSSCGTQTSSHDADGSPAPDAVTDSSIPDTSVPSFEAGEDGAFSDAEGATDRDAPEVVGDASSGAVEGGGAVGVRDPRCDGVYETTLGPISASFGCQQVTYALDGCCFSDGTCGAWLGTVEEVTSGTIKANDATSVRDVYAAWNSGQIVTGSCYPFRTTGDRPRDGGADVAD